MIPVFIPPPDGTTSEQMEREGWLRVAEQKHRARLVYAHVYGQHTKVIEGCPECALDWALFLTHVIQCPRDVMEMFE